MKRRQCMDAVKPFAFGQCVVGAAAARAYRERGVERDAGKMFGDQRQRHEQRFSAAAGDVGVDESRHLARLLPLGG